MFHSIRMFRIKLLAEKRKNGFKYHRGIFFLNTTGGVM